MLDQLEHHLPETWVKRLIKHIKEIAKALGCYLKAEAVLILISFIISLIGLYIFKIIGLNVQYPLMTALGIGFVDALPIFGSGTVMLPWALITACNGDFTLSLSNPSPYTPITELCEMNAFGSIRFTKRKISSD